MPPALYRLGLPALISLLCRLKLARFLFWMARMADYDPRPMRLARRLTEAAEKAYRETSR